MNHSSFQSILRVHGGIRTHQRSFPLRAFGLKFHGHPAILGPHPPHFSHSSKSKQQDQRTHAIPVGKRQHAVSSPSKVGSSRTSLETTLARSQPSNPTVSPPILERLKLFLQKYKRGILKLWKEDWPEARQLKYIPLEHRTLKQEVQLLRTQENLSILGPFLCFLILLPEAIPFLVGFGYVPSTCLDETDVRHAREKVHLKRSNLATRLWVASVQKVRLGLISLPILKLLVGINRILRARLIHKPFSRTKALLPSHRVVQENYSGIIYPGNNCDFYPNFVVCFLTSPPLF
jgi:hypothetical protein